MELLETQDPERKKLIETSDRHKREIEKEVNSIHDKTEKMVTNALIIGGSLALTYFLISQLVKSGKKKKKAKAAAEDGQATEEAANAEPSVIAQIGTKVLNQATFMLLDIAKDQLIQYLESRKQQNDNS